MRLLGMADTVAAYYNNTSWIHFEVKCDASHLFRNFYRSPVDGSSYRRQSQLTLIRLRSINGISSCSIDQECWVQRINIENIQAIPRPKRLLVRCHGNVSAFGFKNVTRENVVYECLSIVMPATTVTDNQTNFVALSSVFPRLPWPYPTLRCAITYRTSPVFR